MKMLSLSHAVVCVWLLFAPSYAIRIDPVVHPRRYSNSTLIPITPSPKSSPATLTLDYGSPAIASNTELAAPADKYDNGSKDTSINQPSPIIPSTTRTETDTRIAVQQFSLLGGSKESTEGASSTPFTTPTLNYPMYRNTSASTVTASASLTETCSSLRQGEAITVWSILPNPKTVTITLGGNYSTGVYSYIPEFTPPVYCVPTTTTFPPYFTLVTTKKTGKPVLTESPSLIFVSGPTTFITTSKNPVTIWTTATQPQFPGGGKTNKETVKPVSETKAPPQFPQPPIITAPPILSGGESNTDGPARSIVDAPLPTTVHGVTVILSPSLAVIDGITYTLGNTPQFVTADGVPIQIGSIGLAFPDTTLAPPPVPTNVLVLDGQVFSAVGNSVAVFDGQTVTYGQSTFTTDFHNEPITLGTVISYNGTTLGGASNTGTQLGIAGGITVTQVGRSIGIISSTSLTVGPEVLPTTVIIDVYTITANSGGIELANTTLSYPFQPAASTLTTDGIPYSMIASDIVVVGGTTYTIGAGSTPTSTTIDGQVISFGPGGIGLMSSALSTTTSSAPTTAMSSTAAAETSKKSAAKGLTAINGLVGIFICIWTGIYM